MMFFFPIHKKQLAVSLIICFVSCVGDKNSENLNNDLAAAICDNLTHAVIGAFTYIGAYITRTSNTDLYFILEILLCAICSSVIDLDHFIAAKSLNLKDATSLKTRPFMHCTTLVIVIVFCVLLVSHFCKLSWMYKFSWILAAALISHHIRDSKRRGFWLWPWGHTVPTPLILYFLAQMFYPQVLSAMISKFTPLQTFKGESLATVETV